MADPRDAGHEADLLAGFLAEEIDAGCAPRGLTTTGAGSGFTPEPYRFHPADGAEHRRRAQGAGPGSPS